MNAAVALHTESGAGPRSRVCAGEGASVASPITLSVPAPPSVNKMFRNVPGKGRVKTGAYDAWQAEAGWRLRLQRPGRIAGPVMILVGVERGSLKADIDNTVKALFDLLVEHRVIEDDSKVVGFAAAWSPARDRLARIAIWPAADATVHFQLAPDGAHGGWFLDAPNPKEESA